MELALIRHALPLRTEVESGAADPVLSEQGCEQSRLLAEYLSAERFDAVCSSPLRRAVETARPIVELQQLGLSIIDGVAEFDRHSSEYVPVEELKAADDPRWRELVEQGRLGTDEDEDDFRRRVIDSVEQVIESHPSQRVAVVCHGGVINTYLAHVLGLPGARPFFYPNYTSIHRVAAARSGQRAIVTINETPHLRGSGLPIGLYQR